MKSRLTNPFLYTCIVIGLISALNTSVSAQSNIDLSQEQKLSWKQRMFYGGGLGLQFGQLTLIDVSPMVGYRITPRIGLGLDPTYKYYAYRNYYGPDVDLKTHVLGCGLFTRILVFNNLFAHAEYEYLSYKVKDTFGQGQKYQTHFESILLGAGYREQIGNNAFMNLLVLWNLNETIDSPYNNPVIRIGFSVGF